MWSAPNAQNKIKVADLVVSTNHLIFLSNRFPRLISLPMSTIFFLGTSGITAILKYRSINPISSFPTPMLMKHVKLWFRDFHLPWFENQDKLGVYQECKNVKKPIKKTERKFLPV